MKAFVILICLKKNPRAILFHVEKLVNILTGLTYFFIRNRIILCFAKRLAHRNPFIYVVVF